MDGEWFVSVINVPLIALADIVCVCKVDLHNIPNCVFDSCAFNLAEKGKNSFFRFQLFDFHIVACFLMGKGRWPFGKNPADAFLIASAFFLSMV